MTAGQTVRIRYITGGPPWPLHGGRSLRNYAFLRALVRLGPVDLLCLAPDARAVPEELAGLCNRAVIQPAPASTRSGYSRKLDGLQDLLWEVAGRLRKARPLPNRCFLPETRRILSGSYDITVIAGIVTMCRLGLGGGSRCILDIDDLHHRELLRETSLIRRSSWQRLRRAMEGRAWKNLEFGVLSRIAYGLVCSEEDRAYLNQPNVVTVHNGVQVNSNEPFTPGIPGRIVFIGTLWYEPNVDGVRFFVREILPRIRAARPDAHLWVVGRDPVPAIRALDDGQSVHVVGPVPDVCPYLADAQLNVVPIRGGSGTRLKIVESLAHKTPVVSTTIGAEGLELQDRRHIRLADHPEAFADACIELLSNESARRRLAEAAFEQVRRRYSWEYVADQISTVVRDALARRSCDREVPQASNRRPADENAVLSPRPTFGRR